MLVPVVRPVALISTGCIPSAPPRSGNQWGILRDTPFFILRALRNQYLLENTGCELLWSVPPGQIPGRSEAVVYLPAHDRDIAARQGIPAKKQRGPKHGWPGCLLA